MSNEFRLSSLIAHAPRSTKEMKPPFEQIRPDLSSDGALRDFYIPNTDETDWNKLIGLVRPNLEPDCFTVDGEPRPLPKSFKQIEEIRELASPLLSIPVGGSYLNCHFFHFSEIELDFLPHKYQNEEAWRQLCQFYQSLVDLIGKRGIATHENSQDEVIEEFTPNKGVEPVG